MLVSLGLNLALVFPLAHAGLALATSLGDFFNAALLLRKLHKDKVYQPENGWWLFFVRVSLAGAVMATGFYYFIGAAWRNDWNSTARVINPVR